MKKQAETKRATHTVDAIPSDITNGLFLGNAALDNVVSCLIAMSAEMWATKRRMKVMEALMAKHGNITPEMIETYMPTPEETAQWEQERNQFVTLALGSLANEGFRPVGAPFPKV
jgi:hypothetical protein